MDNKIIIIVRHTPARKRLLQRAINSVEYQTHCNTDLYILCDNPLQKANVSHSKKIKFINNAAEFNEVINDSTADKIAFIDDDDTWAPEFLSRMGTLLCRQEKRYPSIKGIACHVNKVDEISEKNRIITTTTSPWNHHINDGPVDFDSIYYRNSIPLSSCLFDRKSVSNMIFWHDILSPGFHWPFFIRFLGRFDVWMTSEAMSFYHFRQAEDNVTGNFSIINKELSDINFKIAINNLLRTTEESLTRQLLYSLLNKTTSHLICEMNKKQKG